MNYYKMYEVTVHTQADLDAIPLDYDGHILVKGTDIVVKNRYKHPVTICENARVAVCGNASVVAEMNAYVTATEHAHVCAVGKSAIIADENVTIVASSSAWINASGSVTVIAGDYANVTVHGKANVKARDFAHVTAFGNAVVSASGNTHVEANNTTKITAYEEATVTAMHESSVTGYADTCIYNKSADCTVKLLENAREVKETQTIFDFMTKYGIKHNNKTAIFYKAVHKLSAGVYYPNFTASFVYTIGEYATEPKIDVDVTKEYAKGIHISNMDWCLCFGMNWGNLAIIEVETNIADIILPQGSGSAVRTSRVKVLREVPIEEWGVFGIVWKNKHSG